MFSFSFTWVFSDLSILLWLYWKHSNPAGMDAPQMHLWDVSYSVSEISQRGMICKSLRRLPGDWLKMFPQRRLCDLSGFSETSLSCIWDCNSWPLNWGIVHLRHCYLFIYLRVFIFFSKLNYCRKLFRAWFQLEIYAGYLYKRKTFLSQMDCLSFLNSITSKILTFSYTTQC